MGSPQGQIKDIEVEQAAKQDENAKPAESAKPVEDTKGFEVEEITPAAVPVETSESKGLIGEFGAGAVVGAGIGVALTSLAGIAYVELTKQKPTHIENIIAGGTAHSPDLSALDLKGAGDVSLHSDLSFGVVGPSGVTHPFEATVSNLSALEKMFNVIPIASGEQTLQGELAVKIKEKFNISSTSDKVTMHAYLGAEKGGIAILKFSDGVEKVLFDSDAGALADLLNDGSLNGNFNLNGLPAAGALTPELLKQVPDVYTGAFDKFKTYVKTLTNNSASDTNGLIDLINNYLLNGTTNSKQAVLEYASFAKTLTGNKTIDNIIYSVKKMTNSDVQNGTLKTYVAQIDDAVQQFTNAEKAGMIGKINAMHWAWLRAIASETNINYNFLNSTFGTPTDKNMGYLAGMVEANGFYETWNATEAFQYGKNANFWADVSGNAVRHPYLNATSFNANDSKLGGLINDQNLSDGARNYIIQHGKNSQVSFYTAQFKDGYVMWTNEDGRGVYLPKTDGDTVLKDMGQLKKAWE